MHNIIKFLKYQKYQFSGTAWLGSVPSHWSLSRLGKYFLERRTKVSDADYPALSVTKKGILPQLDSAAKTKDGDNRKLVKSGDFVINSRSDRKGSSGLSDLDGSVSLINIVLTPKGINPKYSHYLLKSYSFIEEYYRVGRGIVADLWTTRYDEMRTIVVAIPTHKEQILITKFLDKKIAQIDEAIAIKEQQIALLKERKQVIIQKAVTQGLDPNVPMKDSGVNWIGQIPEHWKILKLKNFLVLVKEKIESQKSKLVYLGMESVASNTGSLSGSIVKGEGLANIFKKGHILFGKLRPYLAKVYLAEFDGVCSTEFLVFSAKNGINKDYITKLLLSSGFINTVDSSTYGSKMPRANADFILNSKLPVPPEAEQKLISKYINDLNHSTYMLIEYTYNQIEKLKEYKTSLINSAVTGKIKITPEMVED